ncbi:hypothetical protein KR059_001060, partial [Drosophila kikkawai]
SKNICPVTESVAAANAAEILSDKTLKRVSSYPAAEAGVQHKDPAHQLVKPRRHEQTQSQHDSVETNSTFTLSIDPS